MYLVPLLLVVVGWGESCGGLAGGFGGESLSSGEVSLLSGWWGARSSAALSDAEQRRLPRSAAGRTRRQAEIDALKKTHNNNQAYLRRAEHTAGIASRSLAIRTQRLDAAERAVRSSG